LWFLFGFLAILIILGVLFFVSLTSGKVIGALLYVDEGVVQVDSGSGWKAAIDGMELSINDKVQTLEGKATIALYEGEIIRLEPNTQISIKELSQKKITIGQEAGSTWSRLTKLGGVAEYNVETPTTVATVRGTGFGMRVSEGKNDLLVGEGTVNFGFKGETGETVEEGWKGTIASPLVKVQMNQEEKDWVNGQETYDIETLKKIRWEIITRHKTILGIVKKTAGLTEEGMKVALDNLDNNREDLDELAKKAPIKIKDLDRIVKITKKIRDMQATA
jgi:ferric-dicitrate binding protein FerR (iron transport regulator)